MFPATNLTLFLFASRALRCFRGWTLALLAVTLLLLGALRPADAQGALQATPNPLLQSVAPGAAAVFAVKLENVGDAALFLNADDFSFDQPGLTLTDQFLDNFPASLNAGASASGALFTVSASNSVAPGDYAGNFTIKGGARGLDTTDPLGPSVDPLATVAFTVRVAAVPEPKTVWLMLGALGLLVFSRLLSKKEGVAR